MRAIKAFIKSILNYFRAKRFDLAIQRGELNGQLLILMYHRVLPKTDPRLENEEPGMYVTPDTLDMHLSELKKVSTLIHIEDWLALANNDQLDDTLYCAITFDDGWADNYEFGLPLLQKHQAPATVFLATDYIDSNTTFWPERLAALMNHAERYSAQLKTFFGELNESVDQAKLIAKDKDYMAHLINVAKSLSDDDIKTRLDALEDLNTNQQLPRDMLSWDEVRALQSAGIRIGGHTRTHLRLNEKASQERIQQEIEGCALDIESALQQKPTQFCYPNGDTSHNAIDCVQRQFSIAVTTQRGINKPNASPMTLKRVGVHEDSTNSTQKLLGTLSNNLQQIH